MIEPGLPLFEIPLRLRWEKATRYYEVHIVQDLWGGWVLTRIWGRRGSALGQIRRAPCESYVEALERLARVEKRRAQRGYAAVLKQAIEMAVTRCGT